MSKKESNPTPPKPEVDPTDLTETEFENVIGGMQNQIENSPVVDHPGGVNKGLDKNLISVPIRCNWHK